MSVGKTALMKQRRLSTHGTNYGGLDFGSFATSRMSPFKDFESMDKTHVEQIEEQGETFSLQYDFFFKGKALSR